MSGFQTMTARECAHALTEARQIIALTGAGLSTAAGLPDFRGPHGLYSTRRYDPNKVFELASFLAEPHFFYEFSRDFIHLLEGCKETFAHRFLVALERRGILRAIVTQNIDMLHQQAGSRKVIEVHGSYASAECLNCGRRYTDLTSGWWSGAIQQSSRPPVVRCDACRGLLKPDIVFFGEAVQRYAEAEEAIEAADLLLILGSSLQVSPVSALPRRALCQTLVINQGPVALRPASNRFLVEADLDDYLSEVARIGGFYDDV